MCENSFSITKETVVLAHSLKIQRFVYYVSGYKIGGCVQFWGSKLVLADFKIVQTRVWGFRHGVV